MRSVNVDSLCRSVDNKLNDAHAVRVEERGYSLYAYSIVLSNDEMTYLRNLVQDDVYKRFADKD